MVRLQSSKFALSIYESEWYEFSKSLRQDVHIAMVAMKRPLMLKILGLFPLNMESYVQILKAAFSYYTVMARLQEK